MPSSVETCSNFNQLLGCNLASGRLCSQLQPHFIFSPYYLDWIHLGSAICGLSGKKLKAELNYSSCRLLDPDQFCLYSRG